MLHAPAQLIERLQELFRFLHLFFFFSVLQPEQDQRIGPGLDGQRGREGRQQLQEGRGLEGRRRGLKTARQHWQQAGILYFVEKMLDFRLKQTLQFRLHQDPQGGSSNADDASYGGYHLSYEVKKLM